MYTSMIESYIKSHEVTKWVSGIQTQTPDLPDKSVIARLTINKFLILVFRDIVLIIMIRADIFPSKDNRKTGTYSTVNITEATISTVGKWSVISSAVSTYEKLDLQSLLFLFFIISMFATKLLGIKSFIYNQH